MSPGAEVGSSVVEAHEVRLNRDRNWAFAEADRFLDNRDSIHKAMRALHRRLEGLGLDFAIVGGLALKAHGYRRLSNDIDLLVTPEALAAIREHLVGRGYEMPSTDRPHLRDAEFGVRIDLFIAGTSPGEPGSTSVPYPDPSTASVEIGGVRYLSLSALVDMKLSIGLTNLARMRDLADVVERIKILVLPREFADRLDPRVRTKYLEFWEAVQPPDPFDEEGPTLSLCLRNPSDSICPSPDGRSMIC